MEADSLHIACAVRRVCVPHIPQTTHSRFAAAQFQTFADRVAPYQYRRWGATGALFVLFMLRILLAQGWFIVAYALGIYVLNLFIHFLTPKSDPESGMHNTSACCESILLD